MTRNGNRIDGSFIFYTLLWIVFFVLVGIVLKVMSNRLGVEALEFNEEPFTNVGRVLAPLLLIALFIERAVEVVIKPLRGDRSDRLRTQIRSSSNKKTTDDLRLELNTYRSRTRKYAFGVAVTFGIGASLVGVRALHNLILAGEQITYAFEFFDVVITGLILAGGAEGIHKIVTAFTDYAEMISRKTQRESGGDK
jgi:hypothetical protein